MNEDACLGGINMLNDQPVNCQTGYKGKLCSKCNIVEGEKYEEVNEFECRKCPNPLMNAFRVFGLILLIFGWYMTLIIINIRKTSESELSILLRIMTNYLQLITTSLTLTASYPDSLFDFFVPAQIFGANSEVFLSFD